jgi:hypothetical protein
MKAKVVRVAQLNAEILPYNKGLLFDALAAGGIVTATVDFDGYGDSGSLQEPAAFSAESAEVSVPMSDITIKPSRRERRHRVA